MKDIIVLDFKDVKCAEDKNYVIVKKEKCKVEKYPTSWEELKELCNGLKEEDILVANDCIVFRDLNFYKSGIICVPDSEYFSISTGKTPAQMWNIIKNLIGE